MLVINIPWWLVAYVAGVLTGVVLTVALGV